MKRNSTLEPQVSVSKEAARVVSDTLVEIVRAQCSGLGPVGVAVSGGGDSVALMHLLARLGLPELQVATVDHQLRPGSADEARQVADAAADLSLPHTTLVWKGWDKGGNLQDAARQARQTLLRDWAKSRGLSVIALGHTRDDQAETVLMRLARGSGVDGLAGMAARRTDRSGLVWLRPLLEFRRDALRDWLREQGITWIDDPSNDDLRFDRIKARRLLTATSDLGLSVDRLAETAERMASARDVLNEQALEASRRLGSSEFGSLFFRREVWDLPQEIAMRLLAAAHCQVSQNPYRPRLNSLRQGIQAAKEGRAHTLHGCLMTPSKTGVRIQPEVRMLQRNTTTVPGLWAGWSITGPEHGTATCAPLGDNGLAAVDYWRDRGLTFDLAKTLPGIWEGETLIGAPNFGIGPWQAEPVWGHEEFNTMFISH